MEKEKKVKKEATDNPGDDPEVSRRDFVKSTAGAAVGAIAAGGIAGAVLGAATGAGAGAALAPKGPEGPAGPAGAAGPAGPAGPAGEKGEPAIPVIAEKEQTCDVLVVGMGFAGLVAALRAAEQGVNVIIIDKQPKGWWVPGGNLIISGQGIHMAGFCVMLPEEELHELIRIQTDNRAIPEIMDAYVGNLHRGIAWLKEKGVEFEEPPGEERTIKPMKPTMTWGYVKPGGLYDAANYGGKKAPELLLSLIEGKGVKVLYETKAAKLLTDVKETVVGVIAKDKDGLFVIKAKAVILCTGGFTRNKELKVRYIGPHAEELAVLNNPGTTGDGLLMALEVGAATRSLTYLGYYAAPEEAFRNEDLLGTFVPFVDGLVFNENGERLADESHELKAWGAVMINAGYQSAKAFVVYDSVIYEKVKSTFEWITQLGGVVYTADTLEELATKAGVSLHMVAEIEEFNKAVDEGKVAYLRVPKETHINKIATPPFYCIPIALSQISTMGGLLTSPKAEMLNRDGKPIPGLYAAGEVMMGTLTGGYVNAPFHGPSYVGQIAVAMVFGLLAAENAASRAKTLSD